MVFILVTWVDILFSFKNSLKNLIKVLNNQIVFARVKLLKS